MFLRITFKALIRLDLFHKLVLELLLQFLQLLEQVHMRMIDICDKLMPKLDSCIQKLILKWFPNSSNSLFLIKSLNTKTILTQYSKPLSLILVKKRTLVLSSFTKNWAILLQMMWSYFLLQRFTDSLKWKVEFLRLLERFCVTTLLTSTDKWSQVSLNKDLTIN